MTLEEIHRRRAEILDAIDRLADEDAALAVSASEIIEKIKQGAEIKAQRGFAPFLIAVNGQTVSRAPRRPWRKFLTD